ncbi:MAG: LTA synthase family protein [Xanthomonadales bacterium]|nr:LTA synthase family protein [Xanthomonadales bacterium]
MFSGSVNSLRSLLAPLRVLGFLLLVLSLSRLSLLAWYWDRVAPTDGSLFILLQGVRFDIVLMGMLVGPALLAAPWLSGRKFGGSLLRYYLVVITFFVVWVELGTIPYIDQYDARPNYIYVEYLKYPREVFSMLLTSYGLLMVIVALVTLASAWVAWRLTTGASRASSYQRVPGALLLMPVIAVLIFAMIRSTLDHHPVNPSTVAFTTDSMVNQLPLNSPYTLIYAIYEQYRDAKGGAANYGKMDENEALRIVVEYAGLEGKVDLQSSSPTMHDQVATRRLDRPLNLVIILEESLGAEFVGSLGGKDLTPNLDALADEGIWFERLYATGTRSVRGIEAIVSGFPPTSKRSVVKLTETQKDFFTIANVLQKQNFQTSFIYGGSAHFDNMRRFFLNNGFQTVIDQKDFEDPRFESTWGVSDEDLFLKAHEYLSNRGDQPFFSLVFSSSNHKPFEIPAGKVETRTGPEGPREMAVAYADYALGRFLELARVSNYWDNTVFLVVSDHNSRVKGAHLIPIERFHVPGVILGSGIDPRRVPGITSQIDLLPTLLSLMGVDSRHPAIGRDLTSPEFYQGGGRAQLQYHGIQGWLVDGKVVIMQRKLPRKSYLHTPGSNLTLDPTPDHTLEQQALAHALWPVMMIRKKAYHP